MKLKSVVADQKGIFTGTTFAVCQGTANYELKSKLRKKVTSNGGVISYIVTKKCYCLILLEDGSSSSGAHHHIRSARKYGIPVVSEQFVDSCLNDQTLLPSSNFVISSFSTASKSLNDSFKTGQIPKLESEDDRRTSAGGRYMKVWEYLDPNMPPFYENTYTLAKFTVLKGPSRNGGETIFGTVEIHVQTKTGSSDNYAVPKFCLFCYIGSTGDDHSLKRRTGPGKSTSRTCRFTNDSSLVLEHYTKQLQALQMPPRSLSICNIITEQIPPFVGSTEFQKVLDTLSVTQDQIDPAVKLLVADIWKETFGSVGINEPNNQIKVSLKDVDEAEKILIEIAKLTESGSTSEVNELMAKYRALIPQQRDADLSNKKNLFKQRQFLQLFRDILGVAEANPDGILGAYKALNCRITKVAENTGEYAAVLNKIKQNNSKVEIQNIFAVRRTVEDDQFKFDIPNKRILFHGSAFENFLGILSRGLLPSKILSAFDNEEKYGKLGSGIYFTDSFIAGAAYTATGATRRTRLLAVGEVALGKCYETYTPLPSLFSPPNDFNSVHGLIGDHFNNDEFVVYDASQQRLTHLIEFSFPEDEVSKTLIKTDADYHYLWSSTSRPVSPASQSLTLEKILALKEEQLGSIKWRLEDQKGESIPLEAVHVRAQVVDLAAKVVIIQRYFNRSSTTLKETKFVFPLNDETAVCGFEAFIGSKHIVGEVQEKKKAHQMYKEAVEKGHGGYLMDEEEQEKFSVTVGNLPPMTTILIKITFVTELATEGEHIAFRLPKGISQDRVVETLEVGVEMPFPIRRISSPINRLIIKKTDTMATVKMSAVDKLINGLELIIELAEIHVPRMWVEDHPDKSSQACMLAFYPSFEMESSAKSQSTVIIMLDASNSMNGDLFAMAKIIALLCIRKIPADWNFNVIVFGSVWKELLGNAQPKTFSNAAAAEEFIQEATADMGCTDVLLPLKSLFLIPPPEGQLQNVFIISDGHIRSSNRLIASASEFHKQTRIFTLGVGSARFPCDKHTLRKLSYNGSGAFEEFDLIAKSKWMKKIDCQLQKVTQPVITDVNVEWQIFDHDAPAPVQSPIKFPPIFHGSRQLVYGFVSHCNLATLKAKIHGIEVSTIVSTSGLAKSGNILHGLTARALIRDWNEGLQDDDSFREKEFKITKKEEIIVLSKTFSVLSPLTSFVAIEDRNKNEVQPKRNAINIEQLLETEVVDRLPYINYPIDELPADYHSTASDWCADVTLNDFDDNAILEDDIDNDDGRQPKARFRCGRMSVKNSLLDRSLNYELEKPEDMHFRRHRRYYSPSPEREERTAVCYERSRPISPLQRGRHYEDKIAESSDRLLDYEDDDMAFGHFDGPSRRLESPPYDDRSEDAERSSGKTSESESSSSGDERLKSSKVAYDMDAPTAYKLRMPRIRFYKTSSEAFESVEPFTLGASHSTKINDRSLEMDSSFAQLESAYNKVDYEMDLDLFKSSKKRRSKQMSSEAVESLEPPTIEDLSTKSNEKSLEFDSVTHEKDVNDEEMATLLSKSQTNDGAIKEATPLFGRLSSQGRTTPLSRAARLSSDIMESDESMSRVPSFSFTGLSRMAREKSLPASMGFVSSRRAVSFGSPSYQPTSPFSVNYRSRPPLPPQELAIVEPPPPPPPPKPSIPIRRRIDKVPPFFSSSVPIYDVVRQNLIDVNCDLLSDPLKNILKKGCGSNETEFKSFVESVSSETNLTAAQTAAIFDQNILQINDDGPDAELIKALDNAGIKSLGATVRNFTIRMCRTLKFILETLIKAGANLTKSYSSPEAQIRDWAEQLLNAAYIMQKTALGTLVTLMVFVLKVSDKYPLTFKTLQLKNSFSVDNWESFVYKHMQ